MYQGLFSENHGILPANANSQLYAGLVVIFMVATYSLALSLNFLEPRWRRLKGSIFLDKARPMSGQDASDGRVEMSKVSTGRAIGHRWRTGRRRTGYDAGTQWV